MKNLVYRSSTSRIFLVFLPDSASLVGAGKTGLTNASAGLTIAVRRELAATFTVYTTTTDILSVATLGTWADPGAGKIRFREADATNAQGLYELQFDNAIVSASDSSRWLVGMITGTGIAPTPFELSLVAVDMQEPSSDRPEPGQGTPPAVASTALKIDYIYKRTMNKMENDNGVADRFYNAAGTIVDQKQTTGVAGGVTTKGPVVSGP